MNLANLRISVRIALALGSIVALMLAMGLAGYWSLGGMRDATGQLSQRYMPLLDAAADWQASLLQSARHSRNALILDDAAQVSAEIESLRKQRDTRAQAIAVVEARAKSAEGQAVVAELKSLRADYTASEDKFIAALAEGGRDQAKDVLLADTRPKQLKYLDALDKFKTVQRDHARKASELAQATYQDGVMMLGAAAVLAVLSACVIGWLLARAITVPLDCAVKLARTVAAGDLTSSIVVQRRDEFGQLLQALKEMNTSLVSVVGRVRASSDSIATGSAQIAGGNADLSQRTEEQASALQQTAATMEQMGGTVRNNADNAQQANQLAQGAAAVAGKGGEVVGRVVTTMVGISDSSRKIGDIIGVIDGIAFQTNILALNAAVEAARAGEQGRGFAVVAGEVRSLAQRSAEAAKEIKALIGRSVEQVEQGTLLVDEAGKTMGEIVGSIRRVSDIVSEIASATVEQSHGIRQVSDAVGQMDQVTQQNAALVEQSAAAAESLKHQAQHLVQAVAVFKLADAAQAVHEAPLAPMAPFAPLAPMPTPTKLPEAAPGFSPGAKALAQPVARQEADDWAAF